MSSPDPSLNTPLSVRDFTRLLTIRTHPLVTSRRKGSPIPRPSLQAFCRTPQLKIHQKHPMVNVRSFHSVFAPITNSCAVSLKRSLDTPTSAPRKRPNNSSTARVLHIPSTFQPNAPEPAQITSFTETPSSYQYPYSTEFQSIQALIIAYANRDVCLVCHISADTQYPESHSLGRCRSRLAGGQDETFKLWRKEVFNFEFGKECVGCGIPTNVCFIVAQPLHPNFSCDFRYSFPTASIRRLDCSITNEWAAAVRGGRHCVQLGIWFYGTRT